MMYIYLGKMGKRICLSLVLILVLFTNNIFKPWLNAESSAFLKKNKCNSAVHTLIATLMYTVAANKLSTLYNY